MVHSTTSFREFLYLKRNESNVARLLYQYKDYDDNENDYVTTKEINYLTFRNDGQISYLPNGKEHKVNDNGDWSREGRQSGKASKVIRKLFTETGLQQLTDKDFEIFSNQYKSTFSDEGYTFELSKAIKAAYSMKRKQSGTLGDSCMNGDTDYLDIYCKCKQLQILILKNKDGLLCGRSLVWKISDEIILMDRIYVSDDFLYDRFLDYAKKNNFWTKEYYKSHSEKTLFFNPLGERLHKVFKIDTPTDFSEYPYIDTFSFGGDGYLTNGDNDHYTYEYNQTDGTRTGDCNEYNEDDENTIYDEIDECEIDSDDARMIERGEHRNQYTHRDNTVEVNGITYWKQDGDIVEIDGDYYHIDDTVYSDNEDCYLLYEDAVNIDDDWYSKNNDDVIEVDNVYYLKSDSEIIGFEDEYYHSSNTEITSIDGKYYHINDDRITQIDGEYFLLDFIGNPIPNIIPVGHNQLKLAI